MVRRTSARLAKKGKKANAGVDDVHDDLGHDPSFEDSDSEEEEQRPPPPKRQRAAAKPTKAVVRKKHVRGKQGGLAGLVTMPIDIFTEVASHLLPGDIISLARSNKFFRNLLMHRSAIHIWRGAMKNVEGLPPCPPAMSEPHYLALLFSKTCSACGALARVNMDPFLLVRFCGQCRNTRLMPYDSVHVILMPWIIYSPNIMPRKRRLAEVYVLREEASDLLEQYEEKKSSKDKASIDAWVRERQEIYDARREQAIVLSRFINSLERNRERELVDAKAARRSEIQRRLADMGWTEKDMDFGWWSSQQRTWYDLVSRPQPLTDRVWTNLKPKLIPLLEANREERLSMERETRRIGRQRRLAELFLKIKAKDPSVVELKAPNPVPRVSRTMPTISFTYRGPFPDLAHTLKWPVVNNLYETDSSVEEMEANFEARRDEIEGLVAEWRNQIHTYLANQLRDGYQSQGEVLHPTISVLNDNPDALANISDDLKLLLRADSLFHKPATSDLSIQPMSYGTIISAERLVGQPSVYSSTIPRAAPTLDHIHWYPEAHEAAKELLADMGRPDASYLEMKGVGTVFVCGRCHETQVRGWEGMVQHYLEQKQLHAKIQEDEALAAEDITYNDVHDPALFNDLPMITDYATKTLESAPDIGISRLQICKVCEGIPAAQAVIASKSAILKHLLDVHEIADPEAGKDYAARGLIDSGPYGMDYDSDDGYDMHYGCDCAYHMMFGGYDDFDDDGIDPGNMYDYGDYDEDEDEGYWW